MASETKEMNELALPFPAGMKNNEGYQHLRDRLVPEGYYMVDTSLLWRVVAHIIVQDGCWSGERRNTRITSRLMGTSCRASTFRGLVIVIPLSMGEARERRCRASSTFR